MAAPDSVERGASRGRPHLGPRTVITAALWPELEQVVDDSRGSLRRSPFLADLLAWHVARPDLIRDHQLAMSFGDRVHCAIEPIKSEATKHRTVRVPPAVATELVALAAELGVPRGVYNANAIADLLGAPRLRTPTTTKELPLAM